MLADATGGAWVVVEKILAPGEHLPESWPTAGTTGYDSIRVLDRADVRPPEQISTTCGARDSESTWKPLRPAPNARCSMTCSPRRSGASPGGPRPALSGHDVQADPDVVRLAMSELLAHVDTYRAYVRLD